MSMRLHLNNMPFHVGAMGSPDNPTAIPEEFDFELEFNEKTLTLRNVISDKLRELLNAAYKFGQLIGTPLAEDSFGKPYLDDFLETIKEYSPNFGANVLEIGAGVGNLTRRLNEIGFDAVGLEPGSGYIDFWKANNIPIVNDFFPSNFVLQKFDIICCYAVLEHIEDPLRFLQDVKSQLTDRGVLVLSVPDCSDEIVAGDPTILLHEHVSYFDAGSLARLISLAGLHPKVFKSGFGRCLYAVAKRTPFEGAESTEKIASDILSTYPERCGEFIKRATQTLSNMASQGELGIYCAARGLVLLDQRWNMRFFDDDPLQQGKYLPPFGAQIQSGGDLLDRPVSNLVIMSRTFGDRIRDRLRSQGYTGPIVTLGEL